MSGMDISEILSKYKTIAVVGLSKDPSKDSHRVASYMQSNGFKIIPVNPTAYEILGEKCYAKLDEISSEIDIVNIFRPPEEAIEIVEQAIKKGAKVVWMQLGIVNEHAAEKARQAGLEVVVDKCIMVEHKRFCELALIEKNKTMLVPILTEQEASNEFLQRLVDCTKLVTLFVVDKNFLNHVPTAFVKSRIQLVQEVMENMKKAMPPNVLVKDFVEWGDWSEKIESIARSEMVDEIVMKKSKTADELLDKLQQKGLSVAIVQ